MAKPGEPESFDDTLPATGTTPPALAPLPHELPDAPADRYQLGPELARGGMGRILTARDLKLGRTVAVKQLLDADGETRRRFAREALVTARLMHPAIVPVYEAGRLAEGGPFYAMKLVSGRSLDRAIAAATTLRERLALLPRVIAVVDAIAYAHRNRVIHRDLKPGNVLCGDFGETVVIDWGLAKQLDAPEAEAAPGPAVPRKPAAAGDTLAGSVLGTPAFMPPEQAAGDPVDERADVYALGAILYHVIAGRPPYVGKDPYLLVDQVLDGPPPALAQVAPEAPEDLVAIVTKAMARQAAARYASAAELAQDLERFQTGQLVGAHRYGLGELLGRWVRRHRGAVIVGALALVTLAVVSVLAVQRVVRARARAEQQRRLAEQRRQVAETQRAAAEKLVDYALSDLGERLLPIGQLALLDGVATEVGAYYASVGDGDGDLGAERHATALVMLGDVRRQQGRLDEALAAFTAARELRTRLSQAHPDDARLAAELAVAWSRVGEIAFSRGDHAAAEPAYRHALELARGAAAQRPDDAEARATLAAAHGRLGRLLRAQGTLEAAEAELRAALELRERDQATPMALRELASAEVDLGDVLRLRGDQPGAVARYQAALALAARAPTTRDVAWLRQRSVIPDRLGDALHRAGDDAGAMAEYQLALASAEELARSDPDNAIWQRDLSVDLNQLAMLTQASDPEAALAIYRRSLAIRDRLADHEPGNAQWQADVATSAALVANILRRRPGGHAEALELTRRGLGILDKLEREGRLPAEQKKLPETFRKLLAALEAAQP